MQFIDLAITCENSVPVTVTWMLIFLIANESEYYILAALKV